MPDQNRLSEVPSMDPNPRLASAEVTQEFLNDYSESRRRIASLKARLEAMSAALQLAGVHVDYAIQGIDDPGLESALAAVPSPEELAVACSDYGHEVRRSLELAETLAVLAVHSI